MGSHGESKGPLRTGTQETEIIENDLAWATTTSQIIKEMLLTFAVLC